MSLFCVCVFSLNRHLRIVHSDERKFVCTECQHAYKTLKDLKAGVPCNHCVVKWYIWLLHVVKSKWSFYLAF